MLLVCEVCDVSCLDYFQWSNHLISKIHQDAVRESIHGCSSNMAERSVVLWNFSARGKTIHPETLLDHFANFGLVHDIYFHWSGNPKQITACVVLMDSKAVADSIIFKNILIPEIGGKLGKRRDMTEKTWNAIIGNPKVAMFHSQHQKLVNFCKGKSLDDQMKAFIAEMSLGEYGFQIRQRFLEELENWIKERFPDCRLIPFGSFLTGIGGNDADIDIFVQVQNAEGNHLNYFSIFKNTVKHLRNYSRMFKSFIPIPSARIPIIKLVHAETNLEADLSFSSELSTHNSQLIKFYVEYDPRVRPLILLIRYWGHYHNLIGSDRIKTYALVLMAVVFLNNQQIIPSVYYLQSFPGVKPLIIDGYSVAFISDVTAVRREISQISWVSESVKNPVKEVTCEMILELAKDFFRMYEKVNFDLNIVCPLLGIILAKEELSSKDLAPKEIPWERIDVLNNKLGRRMCIQDPFALDYNVTSGVNFNITKKFQAICHATSTLLEDILSRNTNDNNSSIEFLEMFVDPDLTSDDISKRSKPVSSTRSAVQQTSESKLKQKMAAEVDRNVGPRLSNGESDETNTKLSSREKIKQLLTKEFNQTERNRTVSVKFTIPDIFNKIFMSCTIGLDDIAELQRRMNILWVSFVNDFLINIWENGYGFDLKDKQQQKSFITPENLVVDEVETETHSGIFNSIYVLPDAVKKVLEEMDCREVKKSDLPIDTKKRRLSSPSDSKGETPVQQIAAQNEHKMVKREHGFFMTAGNEMMDSLVNILSSGKDNFKEDVEIDELSTSFQTFSNPQATGTECCNIPQLIPPMAVPSKSYPPVNRNKIQYGKIPLGTRKSFSIKFYLESDAKNWIGRDNAWSKRVELMMKYPSELWDNPIPKEGSLTKKLTTENSNISEEMMIRFQCTASVLTTNAPMLLIHLEEETVDPTNQILASNLIASNLKIMLPQYFLYRLLHHFKIK